MKLGKLTLLPVADDLNLVAEPVRRSISENKLEAVTRVAPIDPALADTAAFCRQYEVGMDISANCVIVQARRADRVWYAACIILATTRADVNSAVRKYLDARKISFASMDDAVSLTGMEYGGITPIGLPTDWSILIDEQVMEHDKVIIGSGVRGSKILIATEALQKLPNVEVLNIAQ